MDNTSRRKHPSRGEPQVRRRSWCCSFAVPPPSPDNTSVRHSKPHHHPTRTSENVLRPCNSVPNSPQSSKSGFPIVGRIDPRRILSPGRVSPIDSDPATYSIQEIGPHSSSVPADSTPQLQSESSRSSTEKSPALPECSGSVSDGCDVRLNLRAKSGGRLVLEINSGVLSANSEVFAGLIAEYRKGLSLSGSSGANMCRIEVPEVENLGVFKETIELMFEKEIAKRLLKIGVYRAIDILEVSAVIMFNKGVLSCLKYLEAVPWTEEEEEKMKSLFTRFSFDEATTRDILGRLYLHDSGDSSQQNLAQQLVWSITRSNYANSRNELKFLVKGLLCKSSVYEKEHRDLSKEELYAICNACLSSLVSLFEESCGSVLPGRLVKDTGKPLIECVSRQVDNINWLLEIMLDWQMAEEFVDLWAAQEKLIEMHKNVSPMVRYEVSRVSAFLFVAIGSRKLQCRLESRSGLVRAWFGPMLLDFGWLQRCRKGLDMKSLEEAMGQTLLTLPLKQQYELFMEWFRCFSSRGTECPNLSKAFQIWWRRSSLRGFETYPIEAR